MAAFNQTNGCQQFQNQCFGPKTSMDQTQGDVVDGVRARDDHVEAKLSKTNINSKTHWWKNERREKEGTLLFMMALRQRIQTWTSSCGCPSLLAADERLRRRDLWAKLARWWSEEWPLEAEEADEEGALSCPFCDEPLLILLAEDMALPWLPISFLPHNQTVTPAEATGCNVKCMSYLICARRDAR